MNARLRLRRRLGLCALNKRSMRWNRRNNIRYRWVNKTSDRRRCTCAIDGICGGRSTRRSAHRVGIGMCDHSLSYGVIIR